MIEIHDPTIGESPQKEQSTKPRMMQAMNNRFILEPYAGDRALKAKTSNAFALVQQKVSVVGLRLLADSVIFCGAQAGVLWPKGSVAYIKEESLFTQQWAQKVYESDAIKEKFIIVDAAHIEFVVAE